MPQNVVSEKHEGLKHSGEATIIESVVVFALPPPFSQIALIGNDVVVFTLTEGESD